MKTTGNTVLITGGATGIGFALAEAFLDAGNDVSICGRRQQKLDQAQDLLPGLTTVQADVGTEEGRLALFDWILANKSDLNVLVNNAGIQRTIDLTQGADALAGESEIRIDLEGPIELSALLIPHLQDKPNAAIVNVTSGIAVRPSVEMPIYSTVKAGLHVFSQLLRKQLEPVGIKVFEALPPMILDTELNPEGRKAAAKKHGPPEVRFKHMHVPTSAQFAAHCMDQFAADIYEFGMGVSQTMLNNKENSQTIINNALDQVIIQRCSARKFKSDVPDKDLITQVVEAGRQAPFAGLANHGRSDFRRFFVISTKSPVIDKLRAACLEAIRHKVKAYEAENNPAMAGLIKVMNMISEKGLPPWNAPWLVIVAERKGYPAREKEAVSYCMESMWLKSTALGLGMQIVSAIADLEGDPVVKEVLDLDPEEFVFDACQIGYSETGFRDVPREDPKMMLTFIE